MSEASIQAIQPEGLWDFSLRTYKRPEVADLCLRLQDRDGAEVNLLLFAAWAATQRPALSEQILEQAVRLSEDWSGIAIAPLRATRRAMKESPLAGDPHFDALREQVKRSELEGERLLQSALQSLVAPGEATGQRAITVAAGNALRLLRLQRVPFRQPALTDLRALLVEIFSGAPHLLGELVEAPTVTTADESGTEGPTLGRLEAHLPPAIRHTAVSVMIVSTNGRWLLQRRVDEKCAFGGYWANSCCTHPLTDEAPIDTARRRAGEELGLRLDRVEPAGAFAYTAVDETTGFVESEYDHVFVAFVEGEPEPTIDPREIAETRWFERAEALARTEHPAAAPWYPNVAALVDGALDQLD